jgi:hypothetical protein
MIEVLSCKQRGMRSLFRFKMSKRTVGLFSFFMVFISAFLSKLETIFCVFPAENSFVNALIPFIGVSKSETIFCVFPAENSFVNALIPFIGVSKLETIFCVFLPLKGVLRRVPFIGVRL